MQEPGTYQTRIFDYGGVDRSVRDAALSALRRAVRPGAAEVVC